MSAMTMEYSPRDSTLLNAVGWGDHIEFTLEDVASIAAITEIKRRYSLVVERYRVNAVSRSQGLKSDRRRYFSGSRRPAQKGLHEHART
jgi:Copper binding periplasmic protein CusF